MCSNHQPNASLKDQKKHDHEHKTWSRRAFVQTLGLSTAGGMMLSNTLVSAAKPSLLSAALSNSDNDRILIIVRLKGGNDGLNTIIPKYDYDTYANYRPTLRILENQVLNLNANFGLPPYMQDAKAMWDTGRMKVVHGVGYNDSSLSHFQGSDNWATTDVVNEQETTGWMGRYLNELYPDYIFNPPTIPPAIQIGNQGNRIFEGGDVNLAMTVANPQKLFQIASEGVLFSMDNIPDGLYGDQAEFLRAQANSTLSYAGVIKDAYDASTDAATGYTDGRLSEQLSLVARLIKGNLGTKIYFVELDGFDTHVNQQGDHEYLLNELATSMKAFHDDLDDAGFSDRVLSMTISEFGRRTFENGSNGTDHGASSQMMLFGAALNDQGFVGTHPDLSNLNQQGNLDYLIDFRQVYHTVLSEWLCLDPALINVALLGENFDSLPLGFTCQNLGNEEIVAGSQFIHGALYENNQVFVGFQLQQDQHVDIKLYAMTGQQVATLKNEFLFAGEYKVPVKSITQNATILPGTYMYRLATRNGYYSKLLVIPN
ncbi:hypothetical protein GCM10009117_08500 [Gangjinia marincola]|uniref:DUF1501 domain-containing protein n=1 Tax=Gangjinia marincola TaxID=578463 RepID=A0ABP3XV37_9FLAO